MPLKGTAFAVPDRRIGDSGHKIPSAIALVKRRRDKQLGQFQTVLVFTHRGLCVLYTDQPTAIMTANVTPKRGNEVQGLVGTAFKPQSDSNT